MSSVYDALIKAGKRNETISALSLSWQGISLEWKIMVFVVGLLFVVIVNLLMGRALRTQMNENAAVIATNLSDVAAGYLASKDVLQLKTTVTKYARLNRVAYVYIEESDERKIDHILATISLEVQEELN